MSAENPQSFPVKYIEKEDLLYCRPDYTEQIKTLSRDEMEYIADKMSDGLQEIYWVVMGIVLDNYFGGKDTQENTNEGKPNIAGSF